MSIVNSVMDTHDLHGQAERANEEPPEAGIEKRGFSMDREEMGEDEHSVGYYYVTVGPNDSVPEAMAVLKYRHESRARWNGAWSKLGEQRR
jgi:hypothetical protein